MEPIHDSNYKPDFEIADRYINFSSELLRLSLLAITGLSSVIFLSLKKESALQLDRDTKAWIFTSLVFFALTAGASLFHRFFASDTMSYYIAYLRTKDPKEKEGLNRCLRRSKYSLIAAECLFGGAVIVFAIAIVVLLHWT